MPNTSTLVITAASGLVVGALVMGALDRTREQIPAREHASVEEKRGHGEHERQPRSLATNLSPRTSSPTPSHTQADDRTIALVATLRDEVAALREQMMREARSHELRDASETDFDDDSDDVELEREIEREVEHAQALSRIETLEAEDVDLEWSTTASTQLAASFATAATQPLTGDDETLLAGMTVLHNECFSTYCRVRIDLGDVRDREDALARLMTYVPWEAQSFFQADDDEGTGGEMYITRQSEVGRSG